MQTFEEETVLISEDKKKYPRILYRRAKRRGSGVH